MTDQSSGQGIPPPENAASIIDTDYTVGQHNVEGNVGPFGLDIHNRFSWFPVSASQHSSYFVH